MTVKSLACAVGIFIFMALDAPAQNTGAVNGPGTSLVEPAPPVVTNWFGAATVPLNHAVASSGEEGSVSGTVFDEMLNPVAGAVVTLTSDSNFGGAFTVTTDRQGNYSFAGIALGPFRLNAISDGLRLGGYTRGAITRIGEDAITSITLGPSATVTGAIRDPNGTAPANNARVFLSNGLSTTADRYGNYTFNFVPLGSYSITTTDAAGVRQGASTITLGAQDEIQVFDLALDRPRATMTTPLNFKITNPNMGNSLNGIAFTDRLPEGLLVASPGNLGGDCRGAITGSAGSHDIDVSGLALAAGASCSFSVNVTGVQAGQQTNITGPVSSLESGIGTTSNTAPLVVVAPPSIVKSFSAASVPLNASVTLTFTITNPNGATDLTGVSFNDTLPSGLIIANPDSLVGTCDPGVITPAVTSINLVGGTVLAGSSCTFSIDVLAVAGGTQVNTTDPVTSNEGGTGNTATATVDVLLPDLTITKTHTGNFAQGQAGATYTITVTNSGGATTNAPVSITDTLPADLIATAISGVGWNCTTLTSCTRPDALDPGLSFPPITLTVNVSAVAPAQVTNTVTVSGGGEANVTNNSASDVTTIDPLTVAPLSISALVGSTTVHAGDPAHFIFTVTSGAPSLGGILFSCSGLPAGAICTFDSQGETQSSAQVTLTINTAVTSTAALSRRPGSLVLFAAVLLPLAGLVSIRRRRKLAIPTLLCVMLLILALAGCGVAPHQNVVAKGSYQVTVTATSSATPAVKASTMITLVVK